MKKINQLTTDYQNCIQKISTQNFTEHEELKQKIKCALNYLQKIRVVLRNYEFENEEEEIHFFKKTKPTITGKLRFLKHKLTYCIEKPNLSLECNKLYIRNKLNKLQQFKDRNIQFYRYVKNDDIHYDSIYFLRRNNQLELFDLSLTDSDLDSSTSHDLIAARVYSYDLLTQYYKEELAQLNNLKKDTVYTSQPPKNKLPWTASKTDLIELIYALQNANVIDNGNTSIKNSMEVFSNFFDIDLGNYYKTFAEIKNRNSDQTKFLNKLSKTLQIKIECDNL